MKRCKHWIFRNTNDYYTGTTTISALIAMELSIKYKLRTLLISGDYHHRGVNTMFAQQFQQMKRSRDIEHMTVPDGLDTLLQYARTTYFTEELLVASTCSLYPNLDLLCIKSEDDIDLSFMSADAELSTVLDVVEKYYDVVVWDHFISYPLRVQELDLHQKMPSWINERQCTMIDLLLQDHQLVDAVQRLCSTNISNVTSLHHLGLINMHDHRLTTNYRDVKRKLRLLPIHVIPYDHRLRSSIQEGNLLAYYLRLIYRTHSKESSSLKHTLSLLSQYLVTESGLLLNTSSWDGERRWG